MQNNENNEMRFDPYTGEPIGSSGSPDAANKATEENASQHHVQESTMSDQTGAPSDGQSAQTSHSEENVPSFQASATAQAQSAKNEAGHDTTNSFSAQTADGQYRTADVSASHTIERPFASTSTDGNSFGQNPGTYQYTPNGAAQDNGTSPHGAPHTSQHMHTMSGGTVPPQHVHKEKKKKEKQPGRPFSRSAGVVLIALCLVLTLALGVVAGMWMSEGQNGGYVSTVENAEDDGTPQPDLSTDSKLTVADDSDTEDGALSVAGVSEKVSDSVVEIVTEYVQEGFLRGSYTSSGAGSGVILTEDGYIVTNNHVIDGAQNIHVRLHNGDYYEAELVGTDSVSDIAVLKINATGLSYATLGDSSALVVGERCVAIGNPLGTLGGTVTDGIISAKDREITVEGETMVLLQTNAAVNPGNSGGGLFNMRGELIGIVNAKSSGDNVEGLGFAIPINTASPIIDDLINSGYVHGRFALGVSVLTIDNYQKAMYYGVEEYGTYIYQVESGSNAEKAGLKVGDLILKADGKEIETASDLQEVLDSKTAGDTLELEIDRDGETLTVTVTLMETVPESVVSQ